MTIISKIRAELKYYDIGGLIIILVVGGMGIIGLLILLHAIPAISTQDLMATQIAHQSQTLDAIATQIARNGVKPQ